MTEFGGGEWYCFICGSKEVELGDDDPILEAELADIERRYMAGLLNGEHADLETRRAYEDAAERAREDDAP